MSDSYYISDTHFGHHNIIKYGDRPFKTTEEMDDYIVTMWNQTVKSNDHVSHLGDFTMDRGGRVQRERMQKLVKSLNGHKRLYLGNHDHFPAQVYLDAGFEKLYATWRCEEGFICSHFPLHPQSLSTATACVHGHIHQRQAYDPVVFKEWVKDRSGIKTTIPGRVVPYINVSVEAVAYTPVHKDTILALIEKVNEQIPSSRTTSER